MTLSDFIFPFKLLFWVYFKHSAWQNFVNVRLSITGGQTCQINNNYFCLTDLTIKNNQIVRLFLFQSLFLLPFYTASLSFFILLIINNIYPDQITEINFIYIFLACIGFSLMGVIFFGLVSSVAIGIASSFWFSLLGALMFYVQDLSSIWLACAISLVFGILGSMYLHIFRSVWDFYQHVSELISGLIIGILGLILFFGIPLNLVEGENISVAIGVLLLFCMGIIFLANFVNCTYRQGTQPAQKNYWLIAVFLLIFVGTVFFTLSDAYLEGVSKGMLYVALLIVCLAIPYTFIAFVYLCPVRPENEAQQEPNSPVANRSGMLAGVFLVSIVITIAVSVWQWWDCYSDSLNTEDQIVMSFWGIIFQIAFFEQLILVLAFAVVGLMFSWWRSPVLYILGIPYHTILYLLQRQHPNKNYLLWHMVFWDEYQILPFPDLAKHILLLQTQQPEVAQQALQRLENLNYQKKTLALVKIEWDIHYLNKISFHSLQDIIRVADTNTQAFMSAWLQTLIIFSQSLKHIMDKTQDEDKIVGLSHLKEDIKKSLNEWHTAGLFAPVHRFVPVLEQWLHLIDEERQRLYEKQTKESRIISPYQVGNPLRKNDTSFVGRQHLAADVIEQLIQKQHSVFLCGTYRVGKTSFLLNLPKLLPNPDAVCLFFLGLQGIVAKSTGMSGFFQQIAKQIREQATQAYNLHLPDFTLNQSEQVYAEFDAWLDTVQQYLGQRHLILAFDEFFALTTAFETKTGFSAQNLADLDMLLRSWIQERPRCQLVFTAQYLAEFKAWQKLINSMNLVHIGALDQNSAKQLITQPIKNFSLKYTPEAVTEILRLTACYPALLQLMGDALVRYKNEQPLLQRFEVNKTDVMTVVPTVIDTGINIFVTFEQVLSPTALSLMVYIAQHQTDGTEGINQATLQQQVENEAEFNIALQRLQDLALIQKTVNA